jgi:signal peptidase II
MAKRANMPERKWPWKWLLLAGALILADQLAKLSVSAYFQLGERMPLTSFFNLVLVHNPGASFSFLAGAGGWQRWLFTFLALAVSFWIVMTLARHPAQKRQNLGLTLVLGGALGNMIDRIAYGAVVDFFDFHLAGQHWPAFNLADAWISAGAALLILDAWVCARHPPPDSGGQGKS